MINNLVIVESPAKAKTIEKFLGKDFQVKSSMGHIRDLSKKDFGVDIKNNFKPIYVVPDDKKKIVSELKKLAKEAETIWLASDEDREGGRRSAPVPADPKPRSPYQRRSPLLPSGGQFSRFCPDPDRKQTTSLWDSPAESPD